MPRPGLPLYLSHSLRIFALILIASLSTAPAGARTPKPSKYPLRVHVLAAGEAQRRDRMNPSGSVACDSIEDTLTSMNVSADGTVMPGLGSDPCSFNTGMFASRLQYVQTDQSFSGEGRGDLVSPPSGTQAISFKYSDCYRVRAQPGFQSLPARWKKPGQLLEVLIPSDRIPVAGRPLPPAKCSFSVTQHDYVYLLLPTGRLVEVTQDAYWAKPALRVFLRGATQTIQRRAQ